jgi:hypothetical protein
MPSSSSPLGILLLCTVALWFGSSDFAVVASNLNVAPAGIVTTEDGDVCFNSTGDIMINGFSLYDALSRISILEQNNDQLSGIASNLKSRNLVMAGEVSSLKVQVSALIAQQFEPSTGSTTAMTSVASSTASTTSTTTATDITTTSTTTSISTSSIATSTCSVSSSSQQLAKVFESFDTFVSADGTEYLIAVQRDQSVLYQYDGNGTFVVRQPLWSPATTFYAKVEAFKVDLTQYVALPFYRDGSTYNYRCELFIFNETTKRLVSAQNISTLGVYGVAAVTAQNGITYLAVSNHNSGSNNIPSYIMRFNYATQLFEHFQNFTTQGAHPPEFYRFGSDTYLTFPNNYNGVTNSLSSYIFKLNESSGTFAYFQNISTKGAHHLLPWTRNSELYMSVVNNNAGYTDIFRFDSVQSKFLNITSGSRLFSSSPSGVDVIDIAGSTYMVIAPDGTDARIYKWNDALTRFAQTQNFTTSSGWLYPHLFTIGADTFLALSNRVYKFCGGQFVLV